MTGTTRKRFTTSLWLILAALAVAAAVLTGLTAKKNIDQLRADSVARALYAAAERRLSQIEATDVLTAEALSEENKAVVPSLLNLGRGSGTDPLLRYVKSDQADQRALVSALHLPEEYREYQYILEYQPESLTLTGVFVSKSGSEFYRKQRTIDSLRMSAASRQLFAEEKGFSVGYYGLNQKNKDELTDVSAVNDAPVSCELTLTSGEELRASVTAIVANVGKGVVLSKDGYRVHITVAEADGVGVAAFQAFLPATAFSHQNSYDSSRSATVSVLIDGATHFKDTFGTFGYTGVLRPETTAPAFVSVDYVSVESVPVNFIPGEDVIVTAYVEPVGAKSVRSETVRATANSLYESVEVDGSVYHASVSAIRHLQNLDSALSGIDVTEFGYGVSAMDARQTADIHILETGLDGKPRAKEITFTGISNEALTSFDGCGYLIEGLKITAPKKSGAVVPTGLFSVFHGDTLSGIRLVNTRTIGDGTGAVGGLVGQIASGEKTVTISDTRLYRTRIPTEVDAASNEVEWLTSGSSIGGLVGESAAPLTIENSLAATVIRAGNGIAGGLVGSTNQPLNVTMSYADCYLEGGQIGGLIGDCTKDAAFTSCYSAGFVLKPTEDTVAGKFAPRKELTIEDSYSWFSFYDITRATYSKETGEDGVTVEAPDYSSAESGKERNPYYVTMDASHRIDNGFSTRGDKVDLSAMRYALPEDVDVSYALAKYFQEAGETAFSGAKAGLPHYGDFYRDPDEYFVTVKNVYDTVNSETGEIKHTDEEEEFHYRVTNRNPLEDFKNSWSRTGYAYRHFTKDAAGQVIDPYFAVGYTEPEYLLSGFLSRGEFTKDGEGVYRLTRYVKWEETFGVRLYDSSKSKYYPTSGYQRMYLDELELTTIGDLLGEYLLVGYQTETTTSSSSSRSSSTSTTSTVPTAVLPVPTLEKLVEITITDPKDSKNVLVTLPRDFALGTALNTLGPYFTEERNVTLRVKWETVYTIDIYDATGRTDTRIYSGAWYRPDLMGQTMQQFLVTALGEAKRSTYTEISNSSSFSESVDEDEFGELLSSETFVDWFPDRDRTIRLYLE